MEYTEKHQDDVCTRKRKKRLFRTNEEKAITNTSELEKRKK